MFIHPLRINQASCESSVLHDDAEMMEVIIITQAINMVGTTGRYLNWSSAQFSTLSKLFWQETQKG